MLHKTTTPPDPVQEQVVGLCTLYIRWISYYKMLHKTTTPPDPVQEHRNQVGLCTLHKLDGLINYYKMLHKTTTPPDPVQEQVVGLCNLHKLDGLAITKCYTNSSRSSSGTQEGLCTLHKLDGLINYYKMLHKTTYHSSRSSSGTKGTVLCIN